MPFLRLAGDDLHATRLLQLSMPLLFSLVCPTLVSHLRMILFQLLLGQLHASRALQLQGGPIAEEYAAVQESASAFRWVARLRPEDVRARVGLGNAGVSAAAIETKDSTLPQEAVIAWAAAVGLLPLQIDYQLALGRSYANTADDASSITVFQNAAALAPDDAGGVSYCMHLVAHTS